MFFFFHKKGLVFKVNFIEMLTVLLINNVSLVELCYFTNHKAFDHKINLTNSKEISISMFFLI